MLCSRVQRRTGSTGVVLTVTHGLGAIPDAWSWTHVSNRGVGRTYRPAALMPTTNHIFLVNSVDTLCTLDVFTMAQGGLVY